MARRDRARHLLSAKTPRDKFTELVGSLLLSGPRRGRLAIDVDRAASRSAILFRIRLARTVRRFGAGRADPGQTLGRARGDAVLRRFVMLGIGLLFGLIAFEAGPKLLKIVLENEVEVPHVSVEGRTAANVEGQPEVLGYLAYFGFLFLVLRWWKQADPLRGSRLSLSASCVCVFLGLCPVRAVVLPTTVGHDAGRHDLAGGATFESLGRSTKSRGPAASVPAAST